MARYDPIHVCVPSITRWCSLELHDSSSESPLARRPCPASSPALRGRRAIARCDAFSFCCYIVDHRPPVDSTVHPIPSWCSSVTQSAPMTTSTPTDILPPHRFLFKPVENCETEGCHMDIWLPDSVDQRSKEQGIPIASQYQMPRFAHV